MSALQKGEPFGIVALEALAAGRPVLATRAGGLLEAVGGSEQPLVGGQKSQQAMNSDSTNAILLVEPTVDGLAAELESYLGHSHEATARGERNRELAVQFAWEKAVRKYLEAYDAS